MWPAITDKGPEQREDLNGVFASPDHSGQTVTVSPGGPQKVTLNLTRKK